MRKIQIICIDSGVRENHPKWENESLKSFTFQEGQLLPGAEDLCGHGTAIFGILHTISDIADITMIKIFDNELEINEITLLKVLQYINQYMEVDIINLSMGIERCEYFIEMKEICSRLDEKGVVIVAAFDNAGAISFPAALESVIGVTNGSYCHAITEYEFFEDDVINLAAKGEIQRLMWNFPDYLFLGGNSFACAHATRQSAIFLHEGAKNRKEILKRFKKMAIHIHSVLGKKESCQIAFPLGRSILFPFNKEMHALLRFSDMLGFPIVDVYDTKYSITIGATVSHLMQEKLTKDFIIKNINLIQWDNFDTLILGHLGELSHRIPIKNLYKELIDTAMKYNKTIVTFDDISDQFPLDKENQNYIFYPRITQDDMPPWRIGKLYHISKPVLGIFGTSSRQGKFTLQLKLRRKLLELGYSVGQIGTEPSSLLFGMDMVFPIGYNSSVYLHGIQTILYLNYHMQQLCEKQKDIILVGSQSGTIAYDYGNIEMFPIPQSEFLLGTQPDIVILCVNPYDEKEYIRRTINYIEATVECKVIALVVFPMQFQNTWTGIYGKKRKLTEEEFFLLQKEWKAQFDLPVFELGNSSMEDQLTDYILEVLSK